MQKALPRLQLVVTIPFVVAFIALRHLFHELHEFSHMIVGRVICGVWGTRDFNNVHPMSKEWYEAGFNHTLVGLEGPMINYIAIWLGAILISTAKSSSRLSWGLILIFASLPFARIITALFGGGDEFGVARTWISNPMAARVINIAVILSILIYPLYTAFTALYVKKNKGWYFVGFLILPMLLEGMVVLLFFNYLLKMGVLNDSWWMGSPILVWIVLLVMFGVFIFSARYIKSLSINVDEIKNNGS
jgi:hypothetical protein